MTTLYDAIGGREACRKLSIAFYARVARDPILRPLFPGKTFTCAIEEFAAFLAQFLGGPGDHSQRRWWLSLRESHLRFKIGQKERDAWIGNMLSALDDVALEEPMRGQLLTFFQRSSAHIVNQGNLPALDRGDDTHDAHDEFSRRWETQTRLDEAVAAIRTGDANRAIELAEGYSPSVTCGLLAMMVRSGQGVLLDYVRAKLTSDPTLVQERYAGRTLLHQASAAGSLTTVQLLLRLGANPNVRDAGGHAPLYSVGNECRVEGAGQVVRELVRAGAAVDACEGVQRCTALHMAARRNNVEAAAALLDCGADIEARDRAGDTPLRRAVNCKQVAVAALLLARGANRV